MERYKGLARGVSVVPREWRNAALVRECYMLGEQGVLDIFLIAQEASRRDNLPLARLWDSIFILAD